MSFTDIALTDRMKNTRIMVVDDAEFNRIIIEEIFLAMGMKNITLLEGAEQCLARIDNDMPDLIIMDLMMPEIDGMQCIREIRKNTKYDDIPIIVQTAMDSADERLQAFKEGANDLLVKPINPYELISRFKLHMSNKFALMDLKHYQHRVSQELQKAAAMQMAMLPTLEQQHDFMESHQLVISSISKPCSELGGDLWGLTPLDATRIAIYMFDITGHGVAAALNAVQLHSLIHPDELRTKPVGEYLGELSHHAQTLFSAGEFATFFLGVIDIEKNTLDYAVAASTQSLMLRRDNDEAEWLEVNGIPVGVTPDASYATETTAFHPSDTLLIYSDAFIESPSPEDGKCLTPETIASIAQGHLRSSTSTPKQAHSRFLYETLDMIGLGDEERLKDDLTVALFTRADA